MSINWTFNWIGNLRRSNLRFYLAFIVLSFVLVFFVAELTLRSLTFSSGLAAGSAARRWVEQYWKPINKHGYRDEEVSADRGKPFVLFLGDSFTAGHGVSVDQTYYSYVKERLSDRFAFANLGANGASTQQQLGNLAAFTVRETIRPTYVVHQYFGNDIEDYLVKPRIEHGLIRRILSRLSDVASLVDTYFLVSEHGRKYFPLLIEAYQNSVTIRKHQLDIAAVHSYARMRSDSRIVFVVFPFLNNAKMMDSSSVFIAPVAEIFFETCNEGDWFVDATPLARSLSDRDRVVNFMDAHPSPALHEKVGKVIAELIGGDGSKGASNGATRCPSRAPGSPS